MLKELQKNQCGTIMPLLKIMTIMLITLFSSSAYAVVIVPPTITNPALDSSVRGQIAGQILSIQQFVNAQKSSLLSRLQRLHSDLGTGSSYHTSLMTPTSIQEALYAPESYLLASNSSNLPAALAANEENTHKMTGLWFGSDLSYGSINAEGVSNNRFTSGSLSIGMDYLLKNNLIVGAVAGFGWDTTKIGVQGTETKTTSPAVLLYASYNPIGDTFIDGWLGYGRSSLNNQRWESTDSVFVNGDRTANSYFGSLALSTAIKMSAVKFEPFVRGDFLYSTLGSYNESGNSTRLLSYNTMKFNAISIVGGASASYDIVTSTGIFTPLVEAEYMQSNNVSATQNIFFSNAASTTYSLGINSIPTNISTAKLGLQYQNKQGLSGEVKVGFSKGNNSYISRVLNAQVSIPF